MSIRQFFSCSDWVDHQVLRPLSHIRGNWELTWDHDSQSYVPEDNSYAALLNDLITELDSCTPPKRYHNNEDILGRYVAKHLNWGVTKKGSRWVGANGKVLHPSDYLALLEQGGFGDNNQSDLVKAAAGRIHAAINRGQTHFDEMEQSHQDMLAGVLAAILYHRDT